MAARWTKMILLVAAVDGDQGGRLVDLATASEFDSAGLPPAQPGRRARSRRDGLHRGGPPADQSLLNSRRMYCSVTVSPLFAQVTPASASEASTSANCDIGSDFLSL